MRAFTPRQAVILLVDHGPGGSIGLILNRPTGLVLGNKRGGLPFKITGAPADMQVRWAGECVGSPPFQALFLVCCLAPQRQVVCMQAVGTATTARAH